MLRRGVQALRRSGLDGSPRESYHPELSATATKASRGPEPNRMRSGYVVGLCLAAVIVGASLFSLFHYSPYFVPFSETRLASISVYPRPLPAKDSKEVTFLYWTQYYGKTRVPATYYCSSEKAEGNPQVYPRPSETGDKTIIVHFEVDRSRIRSADVVLFHASDVYFADLPRKFEGQRWTLVNMESPNHHRCGHAHRRDCVDGWLALPSYTRVFDWIQSYRIGSHAFMPYTTMDGELIRSYVGAKPALLKRQRGADDRSVFVGGSGRRRRASVVWVAADCAAENGRTEFVRELMRHLEIDSYGKCLNNIAIPPQYVDKSVPLDGLLRGYKFYLSFENTNCADYVTEKFFRTVQLGLVPIVFGGSDYSMYTPSNSTVIRAADFREVDGDASSPMSPQKLAAFVKRVDSDEQLYRSYFQYAGMSADALPQDFVRFWNRSLEHHYPYCELARAALFERKHPGSSAFHGVESVIPDTTCDSVPWKAPHRGVPTCTHAPSPSSGNAALLICMVVLAVAFLTAGSVVAIRRRRR